MYRLRSREQRLTAVGNRCADHVTPLHPQNLALTSPTGGDRSVGIVRSRTKATEFSFRSFMRGEGRVKLKTQIHVVPTLRMNGVVPPLPHMPSHYAQRRL
jgi:hypothetical protein